MLWLLLLYSSSHATGTLPGYFTYECPCCNESTPAMVWTAGQASGSSAAAAYHAAFAVAEANGRRMVSAAACPRCGELQPSTIDTFERIWKRFAWRQKWRLPIAAAVALLCVVLFGSQAAPDLKHSAALGIAALAGAVAAGAMLFGLMSLPMPILNREPRGVWFSHDPSQGQSSWFPARAGRLSADPPRSVFSSVVSLAVAGVASLAVIGAWAAWHDTFRTIYVVSAEGPNQSLAVRIDGGETVHITPGMGSDAAYQKFEVRTSSSHRVTTSGADGRETSYDLYPEGASNGWVVAPHARERGMCLARITLYYGTKPPQEGDDGILGTEDVIDLPHAFEDVLMPSPASVQLQNNQSQKRRALRALDCAALERKKIVPFAEAPRATSPGP